MKRLTLILALLTPVLLAGCQPAMTPPEGFVAVNRSGPYVAPYHYWAVSADGVAVGLRTVENPADGTLAFWWQAIEGEMTGSKGYKLEKSEDVSSTSGTPGRLLSFSAQRSGADFTYLLAVFVPGRQVVIAEAGGRSDRVTERMEPIRQALLSVR